MLESSLPLLNPQIPKSLLCNAEPEHRHRAGGDKFSCSIAGKPILREVSFRIRRGEYVSIVGPNGAGKTTLLRAMDRMMIGKVSGELYICGLPWADWKQSDLAKLAALVPQADGRVAPLCVEQFLLMCRYPYLSPFATVRQRRSGSRGKGDGGHRHDGLRRATTGHAKQRRAAEGLYCGRGRPGRRHVWLLDEPTTFLDYHHQAEILSLVALANKTFDVTVVAVTHDLNHAVLESDRVIALREGELVFYGGPQSIMKPDVLERIYGDSLLTVEHPESGLPMIVPRP